MDVLIKGIELPKNCAVCPLEADVFGAALCRVPHNGQLGRRIYEAELPPVGSEERRPYWCPLVEVPPHAIGYTCRSCGRTYDAASNYCPNCGARMED